MIAPTGHWLRWFALVVLFGLTLAPGRAVANSATTTVSVTILPGPRLADLALEPMPSETGFAWIGHLDVNNMSGSGAGWSIVVDLVSTQPSSASGLDAADWRLTITPTDAPRVLAGQPIDPLHGPRLPDAATLAHLTGPVVLLQAAPDHGMGHYSLPLTIHAEPSSMATNLPAPSLVITFVAGPGA